MAVRGPASTAENYREDESAQILSTSRQPANTSGTNEESRSGLKRKYTKRQKKPAGAAESESEAGSEAADKDKKQGRWSREEKQKFIAGK